MNTRYLLLAAIGGGVVWLVAGQMSPHKTGIEFSKAAPPAQGGVMVKGPRSAMQVDLPLDLGSMAKKADDALPETLALVRAFLPDAACGKRVTTVDCNTAKLEGSIARNGPVDVQVSSAAIKLNVPIKYSLTATGLGWASQLSEHKAGVSALEIAFTVSLNSVGNLEMTKIETSAMSEAPVPLLRASIRLSKLLDTQSKALVHVTGDEIRRALAQVPVKLAVNQAWDALSQPIELAQGAGLVFKANPESYSSGALVSVDGKIHYRLPIASRMMIAEVERAGPSVNRRSAVLSQSEAPNGAARVRVAVPIDLEAMRQQVETAFKGKTFESQADRFSEPVKVKVTATRLYPAVNLIGLQLDVDVRNAKGVSFGGKLNFAGRPVLDAANGTVTLADVSFPTIAGIDRASQAPGLPRIGIEPFAGTLMSVAKLDISRPLADVSARAKLLLNKPLGEDLRLAAQLTKTEPVSFELSKDGAALIVDLVGDVAANYEGGPRQVGLNAETAASAEMPPAQAMQLRSGQNPDAAGAAPKRQPAASKAHRQHHTPSRS